MTNDLFAHFFDLLITALTLSIFGRVIMTWISPRGEDPISPILIQITEPILAPLRRIIPTLGMFDLTPMVALLLLNMIVRPLLNSIL